MKRPGFVAEFEAGGLLTAAGLSPPRQGLIGGDLPFAPGEPVVLKGLGNELWHKSELDAVHFGTFDLPALTLESRRMRHRIEWSGHAWIGGLVCERIALRGQPGLPSEALVTLLHHDAGWIVICGFGGLQANALAHWAPPCRWPLDAIEPDAALDEFEAHPLGRIWLGQERGTRALTSRPLLLAFLESLWRLAPQLEQDGIDLLELNPVGLDAQGHPRPLDAVGRRTERPPLPLPPPAVYLSALRHPRRIALAGVSAEAGGVGRTILDNLRRWTGGEIVLLKPGHARLFGLPCLPGVDALRSDPVDLLLIALPAATAARLLETLLDQGGGAACAALVAGGIGDGADTEGFGSRLAARLAEFRRAGRWTPAVLGPNFLGHWVPALGLDTSFIPESRLPAPIAGDGSLTLLSQSGAFLLSRRSRLPALRFRLGAALGNQLDVSIADLVTALADESATGPVACYLEGFGIGHLRRFAAAARQLRQRGQHVLVHRAGVTAAGRTAAASHTGAVAGDHDIEQTVLGRAGVKLAPTIAAFDAALTWLDAYPQLKPGPVAVLTNAGFESVNAGDRFDPALTPAVLTGPVEAELRALLKRHQLDQLVAPRLPLDLTPMAGEAVFCAAAALLLPAAAVLVVGLIPFTRRLERHPEEAGRFAANFADLASSLQRPVGIAIDAGADYDDYRSAFAAARLPVFDRMEDALLGLRTLA